MTTEKSPFWGCLLSPPGILLLLFGGWMLGEFIKANHLFGF